MMYGVVFGDIQYIYGIVESLHWLHLSSIDCDNKIMYILWLTQFVGVVWVVLYVITDANVFNAKTKITSGPQFGTSIDLLCCLCCLLWMQWML